MMHHSASRRRRNGSSATPNETESPSSATMKTFYSLSHHSQNYGMIPFDIWIKKVLCIFIIVWIFLITFMFVNLNEVDHHNKTSNTRITSEIQLQRNKPTAPKFMKKFDFAPECTQLQAHEIDFTLVMHSSDDRLWMMEHHCKRWGYHNHISLALFTNKTIEDIQLQLITMGCRKDRVTLQTASSKNFNDSSNDDDYPINQLRNMALSKIQTSHAVIVDIDFFESKDLNESLSRVHVKEILAKNHKLAIVIPAFQLNRSCGVDELCDELNVQRMPYDKIELKRLILKGMATIFDPTNRGGHGTTNYKDWLHEHQHGLLDIPCIKSKRYEPYMVSRFCDVIPPFQDSFNGYGKNKLSWMQQFLRSGYVLKQLDHSFIIHYPHTDSNARKEWNKGPNNMLRNMRPTELKSVDWSRFKRGQNDQLYIEFRRWLQLEVPDDNRMKKCAKFDNDIGNLWVNDKEIK